MVSVTPAIYALASTAAASSIMLLYPSARVCCSAAAASADAAAACASGATLPNGGKALLCSAADGDAWDFVAETLLRLTEGAV